MERIFHGFLLFLMDLTKLVWKKGIKEEFSVFFVKMIGLRD